MATFENWGDYFWPGQIDDCRKNVLGIHDAAQLEAAERLETFTRGAELRSGQASVPQTFDLEHVKAIHADLFQDVYGWAGRPRAVELVRPSADPNAPGHRFVDPENIEPQATMMFAHLGDPREIAQRPLPERVEYLAKVYAGLNVVHPFVEGNGRTQRLFLEDTAAAAGCAIDWSKIPEQNRIMAEAFTAGYQPVHDALAAAVTEATQHPTRDRRP